MIPFATPMLGSGASAPVPTSDPYWSNVSYIHSFQTVVEVEQSQYAHAETFRSSEIIKGNPNGGVFGTRGLYKTYNTDHIKYGDHASFEFGSGPFTVETWALFRVAPTSSLHYLFAKYDTGANQRSWSLLVNAGNLQMLLSASGSAGTQVASGGWSPALDTWHHVVGEFDGTAYRTYANGVMIGKSTTLIGSLHNSAVPLSIGSALSSGSGNSAFYGSLDETRITKGVARYASDSGYTVPTATFLRS